MRQAQSALDNDRLEQKRLTGLGFTVCGVGAILECKAMLLRLQTPKTPRRQLDMVRNAKWAQPKRAQHAMSKVQQVQDSKAPPPVKKRSAGRPSNRGKRREELLAKATLLFNERGISGTSLGLLAEELGIARASVYHYIDSRDELVFQCYKSSCEWTSRDLEQAETESTGYERVIEFVRLTLTPDRDPVAALTEVNSLSAPIAKIICQMNDKNIAHLARFISEGEKDGSIRIGDAMLMSQSIGGMLAWAQLLPLWTYKRKASEMRAMAAETIVALLETGLSVDRSNPFENQLLATDFETQYTNIFDPDQAAAMRNEVVLKTASGLFSRNGVEATSIDEIAEKIGVTKGVLYHYFEDKSDLIKRCYERTFDLYDRFIDAAQTTSGTSLDIVQANTHLNIQAQTGKIAPLMPQPGFGSLPKPTRNRLLKRARLQNESLAIILDQAIKDGIARPFRSQLVTHIGAGAIGWIPKWLPEENTYKPFEISDKITDLFRFGLRA